MKDSKDWDRKPTPLAKYSGQTPEDCPFCHRPAEVATIRFSSTLVGCSSDQTTCGFALTATSIWAWNDAIRLIKALKKPVIILPASPRLVIRLEAKGKVVRAQVVEQNLTGFDFNEECRTKGVIHVLISDVSPAFHGQRLYVRGSKSALNLTIAETSCETPEKAVAFASLIANSVRALNDGAESGVLSFEQPSPDPKPDPKSEPIPKPEAK